MTGYHQYKLCIEACLRCAALCNHCATSCLQEKDHAHMATCIQLNMECAVICYATAELMSLNSPRVAELARICAQMCDTCAEECNKFMHEHCLECADACTKCAYECEVVGA